MDISTILLAFTIGTLFQEYLRYALQEEQPKAPLHCPRCGSQDTKFRYYNNSDYAQPRHYCRTCRRYWTVGGSLRDVPFGGSRRYVKQIKVSSSRISNSRSSLMSPPSTPDEEWQHRSQYPTPMAGVVPQNFDTATIQPFGNPSAPVSPSTYHFNDDISSLAAIQSLIQPQVINESDDAGDHGNGSIDMVYWEECNSQSMPSQPTPQEIPSNNESSQRNGQDHGVNAHYLSEVVSPTRANEFFSSRFQQ